MSDSLPVWKILSLILIELSSHVDEGVTTNHLDMIAGELIEKYKVESVNKGYISVFEKKPFPAYICTSVNDVIAHGIPSEYQLKSGDIINIDMGIKLNGMCADAALTIPVGEINHEKKRLLHYAKKTLYYAIDLIGPSVNTRDLARKIDTFALQRGYVTSAMFTGHGIGAEMHMFPRIYNCIQNNQKYANLKIGDIICIEPMITKKDRFGIPLKEGWSRKTKYGDPSAFFEHMVRVTENGCEILTTHIADEKE